MHMVSIPCLADCFGTTDNLKIHYFSQFVGNTCALQVVLCAFLSLAYGANNAHTSLAILATLRHLYDSGVVPASANLGIWLRCVSTVGAAIRTLLLGKRLAPFTGDHPAAVSC